MWSEGEGKHIPGDDGKAECRIATCPEKEGVLNDDVKHGKLRAVQPGVPGSYNRTS